mgnify:CR=1 FL=1
MNELTFKLYTPLTAEFLPDGSEFWQEDELVELSGYELSDYAAAITEQIEQEGDHLEQYLDDETDPYLAAHVKSIRISVEEHGGELCGCATVIVDEDLTEHGWNDLQEYLSGQYSDGWGEGFEQRDIQVEDGNLNVHFWQEEHFAFTVEQVEAEPLQEPAEQGAPSTSNVDQTRNSAEPSQSTKKYEITDIAHPIYPELHRIRALRQVGTDVPYGTLGGFVQSEANLSQEDDDAWIYGEAICRDDALVRDGAFLTDYAQASGSALIEKEAEVGGWAKVRDNAVVSGGLVQENALICGDAILRKSQRTGYAPMVEGNATVMGTVSGAVHLMGEAFILPGGVLENPTADVLGIHGTHAHLYRTETPDRPKSPKHLER